MTTYDFETDNEGFSITGEGSVRQSLNTAIYPIDTGLDDIYTFELEGIGGFEVVQSINAYGTSKITEVTIDDIPSLRKYLERRTLKDLTIERESGVNILKGEIS